MLKNHSYHGEVLSIGVELRPGQFLKRVDYRAAGSLLPLGKSKDLVIHLHQVTPHLNQHLWQLAQTQILL